MISPAMDWPLSREEKKSQLLRLYSDDVKAADTMVESGNKALEALREELDLVRHAAGVHQAQKLHAADVTVCIPPSIPDTSSKAVEAEVERLRQAVENAAAVLRAILPSEDAADYEVSPQKSRARSEGAKRDAGAVALRPALCRTPRQSGRPKRKVSFGGQPEEEPANNDAQSKQAIYGCEPAMVQEPAFIASAEAANVVDSRPNVKGFSGPPSSLSKAGSRKCTSSLTFVACCFMFIAICICWALSRASSRDHRSSRASSGDPACWTQGFSHELCCSKQHGAHGLPGCWNLEYTFERCCLGRKKEL